MLIAIWGRPTDRGDGVHTPDGLSQWVGLVKIQFLWLWTYTCLVIHLILICISFLESIWWEPSMSVAGEYMGQRTPAHRSHSEEVADLER